MLDVVMPTVRRSAWYAHSETLLQAMLTSEDRQQRLKAVEKILEIRGEGMRRTRRVTVLSGLGRHLRSTLVPSLSLN